ncbi:hypothetical protein Mag101_05350 [Microbulbifer agarilyticus]|uniref:DUF58 domain-containing protein n=1 Tax=Microbulbifer agarilyticus TaxID=260552 RepID=A0A1Q2M4H9_9GAMM|nr:DUF58 domain-containing protein [Microbulbifer agarilyticus]AQQ67132.1 hypothetical protein Mag101_05350 [Microbulbifer agarilyticus]
MPNFFTRSRNYARAGIATVAAPRSGDDPRVHVDLAHLQALEGPAQTLNLLPHQPVRSVLAGQHHSPLRGRGLNFEELREYWPSDDVRSIDWKVTARTGEPHVRVYTEERDRPALIVADQRMSMFYGTHFAMKSVTAAEAAAYAAFAVLHQNDRVGGIVVRDDGLYAQRPKRNRRALTHFLSELAQANQRLHADAPPANPTSLDTVLQAVANIARRDHLVLLISDFDVIGPASDRLLAGLARHNDVILMPVSDPTGETVPEGFVSAISDGDQQATLDTSDRKIHSVLNHFTEERRAAIAQWQRRYGIPLAPLSAGEETLPQLRRLLGLTSNTAPNTASQTEANRKPNSASEAAGDPD